MRYLYAFVGFFIFLATLGFALKNADPITLHYYLGIAWQAPLSLTLLIAFCCGVFAGLIACLSLLVAQRRRLAEMQREIDTLRR
jgi:putative membrane protein